MNQKLTTKQKRFIEEYLVNFNGHQAALKAGYSKKSAKQIATENLSKPYIKAAIEKQLKKKSKTVDVRIDEIISELREIAFNKRVSKTLKYGHKLKALELLGKYKAMFIEKMEHSGNIQFDYSNISDEELKQAEKKLGINDPK